MFYCTEQNLRDAIAGLTADNTKVTTAFLQSLIEMNSTLIDARIALTYQLPISTPKALLILKKLCVDLCREEVSLRLGFTVQGPLGGQYPVGSYLSKRARSTLDLIADGLFSLVDAAPCGSCSQSGILNYDNSDIQGVPYGL